MDYLYITRKRLYTKFKKSRSPLGIFFVGATHQLVLNIKPITKWAFTFSSVFVIGIYIMYNIYKFQENQRAFLSCRLRCRLRCRQPANRFSILRAQARRFCRRQLVGDKTFVAGGTIFVAGSTNFVAGGTIFVAGDQISSPKVAHAPGILNLFAGCLQPPSFIRTKQKSPG